MRVLADHFSRISAMGAVLACVLVCGCTFVEFERSPYAARDLVVVYSSQEDLSFLSWKLGEEADVEAADFELYRDGDYRPIEIDRAPYPAAPYSCGNKEQCVQFQVDGRLPISSEASPVRTVHEGIWGGPRPEVHSVETTFGIAPFAIDNNDAIDPGLSDWFSANDVPLRRDFEFQLVERAQDCAEAADNRWRTMGRPSAVDYGWVEQPKCFASRPKRRDTPGPVLTEPLDPSAETFYERQRYEPTSEQAPIIYGVLLDLHIADESRCHLVKERLLDMVDEAFDARGEPQLLDVYLPIDAQSGDDIEDCTQSPNRYYPVGEMLLESEVAAAPFDPQDVRVVWLYVNNSRLPVDEELIADLDELSTPPSSQPNLEFFHWSLGYGWARAALGSNAQTGWRPIDDETLEADIDAFADNTLPFLTMKHDSETEVTITRPQGADDPRFFKVCTAQPPYAAVGNAPGQPPEFDATSPAAPWPAADGVEPFYTVELIPQHLVEFSSYRNQPVEIVVEVCSRFCDHAFRTAGGRTFDNWTNPPVPRPMEACQWSQ